MSFLLRVLGPVAGSVLLCLPAPAVELARSRPLGPKLDGMPRVAGEDAVARRINTSLRQAEDRLRGEVRSCRERAKEGAAGTEAYWERGVQVVTRGPRFLSLLVSDDSSCGGMHPNTETLALVFDLRDGSMADWSRLLPPALGRPTGRAEAMSGGQAGLLLAPALAEAYRRLYPSRPADGMSPEDQQSCREAVAMADGFIAWPSAAPPGLAVQPFGLPHAVTACAEAVVIPTATLRGLGVSEELASDLDRGR